MKELGGRTAVVTGAASGIGRGIALALGAEGMRVAVADVDTDGAAAVAREIGPTAFALALDVTSEASLEAGAKEVAARSGGAHVLVNNAGVMLPLRPMSEASVADWEYILSVNLLGVVKCVAAFLPQLRAHAPDAHIVNTASMGGLVAVPSFPIGPYVASKYACVGYSESLRGELAPEGIGVSVLCPGMVVSNLGATSARNRPGRFGSQAAPPAAPAASAAASEARSEAKPSGAHGPEARSEPQASGAHGPEARSEPQASGAHGPEARSEPQASGAHGPEARSEPQASGAHGPEARSEPQASGAHGPEARSEPQASGARGLAARMLKPEDVGPVVVRGIRANRLHLFTHLDARAQVERRFAAILADFEAEAREREG